MFKILKLNQISATGLEGLSQDQYEIASEFRHPDAILVRSHVLTSADIVPSVKAIARAGAGVNNIPVDVCTERGIPVFNTPGANANAVKELVLAALILTSRGVLEGIEFVKGLTDLAAPQEMTRIVEKEKKRFRGQELLGKTLGVIGLGTIGSLVAEMGLKLGMQVVGYDPSLSVDAAWRLSNRTQKIESLPTLLAKSDYVTLHLPVLETTQHMINHDTIRFLKPGSRLLNFSRGEIVNPQAIRTALESQQLARYATDFPTPALLGRPDVILLPHLGASTTEAEDACAVMATTQLADFLEHGNIINSVNFPTLVLERSAGYRIAVSNKNIPKMLGKMLAIFADRSINVIEMLNKSRHEIAYNLIDIETPPSEELLEALQTIEGVIAVRSV
ncbi:3-phosphoglycerate dehydrogenase [candidate division KSB3 bacterium]|uniref:D-3-phosphoglycerate dehydrogenase n=1 Tax=candidate division KSB3 bacterium TaxID=2044937 RepID=A0A9D5Q4Q9_9BACT|nr:3-phosphoglycerate dehydrogenase [candidate division KSB3 bacterium]MBD3323442.1 3-phosphoglycerate dehydrogenase [candidate division KSB3 bacterium]